MASFSFKKTFALDLISAAVRLHTNAIDTDGLRSTKTYASIHGNAQATEAFQNWWDVVTRMRERFENGGVRRDLEVCVLRENLTKRLADRAIFRSTCTYVTQLAS